MNRKRILFAAAFLLIFLLLFACKDSVQGPGQTPEFIGNLSVAVFPDIGTLYTDFQFTPAVHLDGDSLADASAYQYRFDWEADGTWDTDWLDSTGVQHRYAALGKKMIRVLARDAAGAVDTAEARVYVQELVQITRNESQRYAHGNIDWSRDGSNRITFDWRGAPNWRHHIWVVDYPGGTPQPVTSAPDADSETSEHFPEWSPDGKRIAFGNDKGLAYVDLQTGQVTQLVAKDGLNVTALLPRWSPAGRWILYQHWDNKMHLFDLQQQEDSIFDDTPYVVGWSPDGQSIASIAPYGTELQIFSFPNKDLEKTYPIPFYALKVDWSPNGKWLSLGFNQHWLPDTCVVAILSAETGKVYYAQIDGLIRCWYPSWSEDGSLLAFEAEEKNSGRYAEIWAIRFPEDLD